MKLRTLAATVGALAILTLGARVLNRPPAAPPPDPRAGRAVVNRDQIEAAAQIRITDAGGSAMLLVRRADGSWRVATSGDAPVDFAKLARFMEDLAHSRIRRFVTADPERLADLDFTKTQVALLAADGRESWSMTLGKVSDLGGRYVRFGAEEKAYLADIGAIIDIDPRDWVAGGRDSAKK